MRRTDTIAALTLYCGICIRFFTSRIILLVGRGSPKIDLCLTGCISLSGVLPVEASRGFGFFPES